ncbi:hypothetical protein SS50377_28188 [Spironucleus salmonicida]|uniref:Uncharacterized protein n=1 Tax=Spironucleus salmonicida TaxID=348837 RepID=A0A9P8LL88_9EUKA|nr:hypothetical protein SS50377_28188 [Spironucleus salmonicida]
MRQLRYKPPNIFNAVDLDSLQQQAIVTRRQIIHDEPEYYCLSKKIKRSSFIEPFKQTRKQTQRKEPISYSQFLNKVNNLNLNVEQISNQKQIQYQQLQASQLSSSSVQCKQYIVSNKSSQIQYQTKCLSKQQLLEKKIQQLRQELHINYVE